MLARQHHPRACLGLLAWGRRYGNARLEAACLMALQLGSCKYNHIRDMLVNRSNQLHKSDAPEWSSPAHAHEPVPG